MAKKVRTRIFIAKEPGGKRFYSIVYWPDAVEAEIRGGLKTQSQQLVECRALAKKTGSASISVQGKDGRWKEVYSTPAVRNSDERNAKKQAA